MRRTTSLHAAGFVVIRTPLLPFDDFINWGRDLHRATSDNDEAALDHALAHDDELLRARLRAMFDTPEIREALFLASPAVEQSLPLWQEAPTSERGQKIERALVRYIARMAGRATPFGLFAGISVAAIADGTHLVIERRQAYTRHSRLDSELFQTLVAQALAQGPVRGRCSYRPNAGLYNVAGRWCYPEGVGVGAERRYRFSTVEDTPYLRCVLETARDGAPPSELAKALVAFDAAIAMDEAVSYVVDLIENDILVADWVPAVTGAEPLDGFLAHTSDIVELSSTRRCLEDVRDLLGTLDAHGVGRAPSAYAAMAKTMATLGLDQPPPALLQVDLSKPAPQAALGRNVVDEVCRAVELLYQISPQPVNPALESFVRDFTDRYDTKEVPLMEALDEDVGVGFHSGTASADGVPPAVSSDRASMTTARNMHLTRVLLRAFEEQATEVQLSDHDVKSLDSGTKAPLPAVFSANIVLLGRSDAEIAAGEFKVCITGTSGPGPGNLLARFCHGDARLTEQIKTLAAEEESIDFPGAIVAEVVHWPAGLGNVVLRPVLRQYEIPYLGRSGAPAERQLLVSQLLVSVREGRVVLRDRLSRREVVPRLSTAHNYALGKNAPVYSFLASLQGQGCYVPFPFTWGPLDNVERLPRLVRGRIVVSTAKWKLVPARTAALVSAQRRNRFRLVQALRRERGLPRFVAIKEGDRTLPVDFENALSVDSFVHTLKQGSVVTLEEIVGLEEGLCVSGPEGRFVHQMVVPLIRRRAEQSEAVTRPVPMAAAPVGPAVRTFPPASEWLYVKLYCGVHSANRLLRTTLPGLTRRLVASGDVRAWFYVRYRDPEHHLRLRFRGTPDHLTARVLPAIHHELAPAVEDGTIWRIQVDTYEREVERYGGPAGVELSEELFHADSEAVLAILDDFGASADPDLRWKTAMLGVDRLLSDFQLPLSARLDLVRDWRAGLSRRLRLGDDFDHQLGVAFRSIRSEVDSLLDAPDAKGPFAAASRHFAARSPRIRAVVARLREADHEHQLSVSVPVLLGSYAHMHTNRLLNGGQRREELVIYDYLSRRYESLKARHERRVHVTGP